MARNVRVDWNGDTIATRGQCPSTRSTRSTNTNGSTTPTRPAARRFLETTLVGERGEVARIVQAEIREALGS